MPGKPSKESSDPKTIDLGALASKKNFDSYIDHRYTGEEDIPYFDFLSGKGKQSPLIVYGSSSSEDVILSAFSDHAEMGGGDDIAVGGPGNDTIFGGDGGDYLFGDTDLGIGNVDWQVDDFLSGDAGDDLLVGDAPFLFDTAIGGDDTLNGGAGNDTLWGDGTLLDDATGGADVFVFDLGSGLDVIMDFEIDKDLIDISAYGITAFSDLAIFVDADGTTIDLDGSVDDIDEIYLAGVSGLDADDFIFALA